MEKSPFPSTDESVLVDLDSLFRHSPGCYAFESWVASGPDRMSGVTVQGDTWPSEVLRRDGRNVFEGEGKYGHYLAGIACSSLRKGIPILLVSADSLTLQLSGPRLDVHLLPEGTRYTGERVKEEFGVDPWRVPEFLAQTGHESTREFGFEVLERGDALILLEACDTLEELWTHPELARSMPRPLPDGVLARVVDGCDLLIRALKVLRFDTGSDLPVSPSHFARQRPPRLL